MGEEEPKRWEGLRISGDDGLEEAGEFGGVEGRRGKDG